MAILGKIDRLTVANVTVAGDGVTVTGPGDFTDPVDPNYIEAGDILEIDDVPSVVYSVTNATTLVLKRAAAVGAATTTARRTPPKEVADYVNAAGDSFVGDLLGVSLAEAQDAGARSRGITGPGWWYYKTYVDGNGTTRHKAECIASFKIGTVGGNAGVIGDDTLLDDATTLEETLVGEVDAVITLVAPTAQTTTEGIDANFDTTGTTVTSGALFFQWQRKPVGGRFTNISNGAEYAGTDSPILTVIAPTVADNNGDLYRVKVTSDSGAAEVVSDAVALTVNP